MNRILDGLRVIEGSAFVAAPLCGMTLAQMGAEVIRFDPLEGGLDARRWPLTAAGRSLYWVGLNKGKRSIAVNTRTPEGQELITALITAPGEGGGIFLTNFPAGGWMSYEKLAKRRADLIMLNLLGNPDGSSAVDYTVNCAIGIPFATGPTHGQKPVNPVNHVLPAWDAITGVTAALGIVAADRHRRSTGEGQFVKVALSDVAMAMVGNLGLIAEAQVNHEDHYSFGNYLYGAYGREFETKDDRYVYVVAITRRQWEALLKVTGTAEQMKLIEPLLGVDLTKEGDRFKARDAISAVLAPWFDARTLNEVATAFDNTGVCWGPYQTFIQMVENDPRCSTANPMFAEIEQPGIGSYLVPGSPLEFAASPRQRPVRAPMLGEHTDEVLSSLLGLGDGEIGKLRDKKIIGGPIEL
ncbi:MAG: CoA transferase [Rhodospirillales bacterium]|jgi:2-methylfumaryl-CoA isomerase|nr:CoA transferase [Rhodospirillales bacterium]